MFELIKELSELPGPVGQEQVVLDRAAELWAAEGAEVERTRLGNIIGRAGGKGPKLLLAAHADELCYLVRAVDPGGFLWLANGQGWERKTSIRNWYTVGQRVLVLARNATIPGVIAAVTGHLATLALKDPDELTWDDYWVDTGLPAAELEARGVTPGTRVIWNATTEQWGEHITGKALDDRVPLAVITEVLRRVPREQRAFDLSLGCTVQEEVGLIGMSALATSTRFDEAIAVEVGMAGDIPGVPERAMPLHLGCGPVLVHKDALVHYDYTLTAALERTAGEADIPIQHAVFGSFGSDGAALMKANIPAALVAFPTRYTHSAFEMGHLGDIEALVEWLCAYVGGARQK